MGIIQFLKRIVKKIQGISITIILKSKSKISAQNQTENKKIKEKPENGKCKNWCKRPKKKNINDTTGNPKMKKEQDLLFQSPKW